ncbi:uncharacterized protein [Amphiura filiformis]|uniref:uncharacterized protein n=1 Tax=Amphiura filiformis TaxID=82378 RepID=UPI003B21C7DF
MASHLKEWLLQIRFSIFVLVVALPGAVYTDKIREYEIPGEACGSVVELGDQYKVFSKLKDGTYIPNTDCSITFRTNDYDRWYIRVTGFNIDFTNRCNEDKLLIYNIGAVQDLVIETDYGLCGYTKSLPNYYYTKNDTVKVQFVTNNANTGGRNFTGFELLLTPFNDYKEGAHCDGFRCKMSKKCIPNDAFCNGEYQCDDYVSDEPTGCVANNRPWKNTNSTNPTPTRPVKNSKNHSNEDAFYGGGAVYGAQMPFTASTPTRPVKNADSNNPKNEGNSATKNAFISGFILHTAWIFSGKITQLISD